MNRGDFRRMKAKDLFIAKDGTLIVSPLCARALEKLHRRKWDGKSLKIY